MKSRTKHRIPLRGDADILPGEAPCGAKAGKPEGWSKPQYPTCNRPARHALPHREYDKQANVLYEWYEALDLGETSMRNELRRMTEAERRHQATDRYWGKREANR